MKVPNQSQWVEKDSLYSVYNYQGFTEDGKGIWKSAKDTIVKTKVISPVVHVFVTPSRSHVLQWTLNDEYYQIIIVVGIALIIFGIIVFITNSGYYAKGSALGLILLTAISIGVGTWMINKRVSDIALNNEKWMTLEEYNKVVSTDGGLDKWWDSKWDKNEIITNAR
jgi:hypothetical protein